MRDLLYLNSIYETLDEGVGLRSTKLKSFYDAANGYESQRHPETDHRELISPSRRNVKYDYGKANYDEISAEEAIRLVQQDKYNIQKLRIIYDLNDKNSLVEYEVRDNGSVYAIYGSGEEVEIDGKWYKNIRYAPWKKVLLNADLIYVTDEYDKRIDDVARNDKKRVVQLSLPADKSLPGYDPHNLYVNRYQGGDGSVDRTDVKFGRYTMLYPDTGAHISSYIYKPLKDNPYYKLYASMKDEVKRIYGNIDRYRRALRKLEQDKDVIGDEEYNLKKTKWEEAYKNCFVEYNDALKAFKSAEDKIQKEIDIKSAELADKVRKNLAEYDAALQRGFELSTKIQTLKSELTADLSKDDSYYSYDSEIKEFLRRLKNVSGELIKAKENLEEILDGIENEEGIDRDTATNRVDNAIELFSRYLEQVDNIKVGMLNQRLKDIDNIAQELKDLDITLARLRPKTAAEKQAKAAKNKPIELDPELVNILDFGDDSDPEE